MHAGCVLSEITGSHILEKVDDTLQRVGILVLERISIRGIIEGVQDALSPAVLVTAYRPESERWLDDYSRRIT